MKSAYYLLLAISKQAVQHYCFELVSRPCFNCGYLLAAVVSIDARRTRWIN